MMAVAISPLMKHIQINYQNVNPLTGRLFYLDNLKLLGIVFTNRLFVCFPVYLCISRQILLYKLVCR